MGRALFLSLAIAFVSSLCFAQETPAPSGASNSTASARVKTETFIGRVDWVSRGNAGTKSKILVRDDKGKASVFIVTADTAIFANDGNPTTLDWTEHNKVAIEYTVNQEGIKTVKSIKVLTDW